MNEQESAAQKMDGGQVTRDPIGTAAFHVTARVAMQLGRQSISNSITAIIELVKNAYDADANNVEVRFEGLNTESPRLVIEDDGLGMTLEEFEKYWFSIGTTHKLQKRSSLKGRVLTGEKGLGRLGLDRLARLATIRTFTEESSKGTELVLDWKKYESRIDEPLESVEHQLYTVRTNDAPLVVRDAPTFHGTQIILEGLRDQWNLDSLSKLWEELSLLVSPFAGINDFSIFLETGIESEGMGGEVGSLYMLDAAEWYLSAWIDKQGNIGYQMESNQHEREFNQEAIPWEKVFADSVLPRCGPLQFRLYFYPRKSISTEDLKLTRSEITEFLNANQGIRVYRDGFRVKPYGNPDGTGDWLALSYRRQQSPGGVTSSEIGQWRVGYNQVVGAVFINREHNPQLIDQTNRESIVEGKAFSDLRSFALWAVGRFEVHRQRFEKSQYETTRFENARQQATRSSDASAEAVRRLREVTSKVVGVGQKVAEEDVETGLEELADLLLTTVEEVDKKVAEAEQDQKLLAEAAEAEHERLKDQKDTLGNLASLGILATTFGHETQASTTLISKRVDLLKYDLKRGLVMILPEVRADIDMDLEILSYHSRRVNTFAKFTLQNVRRDKRKRVHIYLNELVETVFSFFSESLQERTIVSQLNLPETIAPIKAFRIDWESILVNFISNSIWAMERPTGRQRVIRVTLKEEEGKVVLLFADSGKGLEPGTEENIFLPTFSTKRGANDEVIGTGMGLTIVRDFIESYPGGNISVVSTSDLGGAEFRVEVSVSPYPNGSDE